MFKYIWISLITFFIISCSTNNIIDPDISGSKGQLSFSIDMTQAPDDVVALQGILSRADHDTVFFDFEMRDSEAVAEVEGLISGTWLLRVNALDEEGHIIYSGSTDVTVVSGQTTVVYLNLEPTTGNLRIIVTWGDRIRPVAYYPFNGNANDESGNGNDGVVFGDPTLTYDKFEREKSCYEFDVTDDYINTQISADLIQKFTVMGWYYWNGSHNRHAVGNLESTPGSGWAWKVYNNKVRFGNNPEILLSETDLVPERWYHIAVSYDGVIAKIYIDGELDSSGEVELKGGGELMIAALPKYTSRYNWDGKIDEVMVFDHPLNIEDIHSYFENTP